MEKVKTLFLWTAGILAGVYFTLMVGISIPSVQVYTAHGVENLLHDLFDWRTHVGRVRLGLLGRVIMDDVGIWDKEGKKMVSVNRVAVRMNFFSTIFMNKVSISNAQLFGAKVLLYQKTEDSDPNFQFLIDTFKSKEKSSHPLDLHIGSILLRNVDVRWDQQWKEETPGKVNPAHIDVEDFALTARIRTITPDSVDVSISRLSAKEKSGIAIKRLQMEATAGESGAMLSDFHMTSRRSLLEIPLLSVTWKEFPGKRPFKEWLEKSMAKGKGSIHADVVPADFSALVPQLSNAQSNIILNSDVEFSGNLIKVSSLNLHNDENSLQINLEAKVLDYLSDPKASVRMKRLRATSQLQQFVTRNFFGEEREVSPYITRLGYIDVEGEGSWSKHYSQASMTLKTAQGNLSAKGDITNNNYFHSELETKGFSVNKLLSDNGESPVGEVALKLTSSGAIKAGDGKPAIKVDLTSNKLEVGNHTYDDVLLKASCRGNTYEASADISDPFGSLIADASFVHGKRSSIKLNADIRNLSLSGLSLTKKFSNMEISSMIDVDVTGSSVQDWTGDITLEGVSLRNIHTGQDIIPSLSLYAQNHLNDNIRDITVFLVPENADIGTVFDFKASGRFHPETLHKTFMDIANAYLPSIFPSQKEKTFARDELEFSLAFQDTSFIRMLTGKDITIPQLSTISGQMNGNLALVTLDGNIPDFSIGNQKFTGTKLTVSNDNRCFLAKVATGRNIVGNKYINLAVNTSSSLDRVRTLLSWDTENFSPSMHGVVDLTTNFPRNMDGKRGVNGWFAPSEIVVADTLWRVHPSTFSYHDNVVDINNFNVSQGTERGLKVNGRLSALEEDTVRAEYKNLDFRYILDLIPFRDVLFHGDITGIALASSVFKKPVADAYFHIDRFLFNYGEMGKLTAHIGWGHTPHHLDMHAHMVHPEMKQDTQVDGFLRIGDKEPDGLDLTVKADSTSIYFINYFTPGIFENLQGRSTGWCRVFGTFKKVDIEGKMLIDWATMGIPVMGARYTMLKDTMNIRPGIFELKNALIFDQEADKATMERRSGNHSAVMNVALTHRFFKNWKYRVGVQLDNLLGYNHYNMAEGDFGGILYGSGNINLEGSDGWLNVDINTSPEKGSMITYNMDGGKGLTENSFISYVAPRDTTDSTSTTQEKVLEKVENDIHINFSLNLNPNAHIRIIMNRLSGDYIQLGGYGRITASFYNKGAFKMYGTYRVSEGIYKMSVQDLIRRDFQFQDGGTISFGGDPLDANLNMKAYYRVPNVSLNDLGSTSLDFAKTSVDCIMNLTGTARAPMIGFDFDLPLASEDQKQMVRAMVSTEEERNMQVMYLLGIGRFYSNAATTASRQSGTAVNSFVASTLSTQFNQLLSQAVGNTNWSFGANLQTGENGWSNVDVEGMLSGRMMNGRLLVNGNFGYRESYYTKANFIGDCDVQYLLNKNGSISLKAYNQTNDRYFVQSSLYTQGLGIQFQKNFDHFADLFKWKKFTWKKRNK